MTCGNPCPVVSWTSGTIWLPFCKNLAAGHQGLIMAGKAPRTVWLTCSTDDGASWANPWEITAAVKHPACTWIGTGPCHGIQLDSGRLVVPSHYAVGRNFSTGDPYHSCVIYSDDEGASWRTGGSVGEGTDECAVVQTAGGRLYINCRNPIGVKCRAFTWSDDRGDSFAPVAWDASLVEPDCQGSLARFTEAGQHDRDRVLFANPASLERARLSVRVSYDECLTWSQPRVLHAGPAAYSDLIAAPSRTACCLYECGEQRPYERITLARFNTAWIDAA